MLLLRLHLSDPLIRRITPTVRARLESGVWVGARSALHVRYVKRRRLVPFRLKVELRLPLILNPISEALLCLLALVRGGMAWHVRLS